MVCWLPFQRRDNAPFITHGPPLVAEMTLVNPPVLGASSVLYAIHCAWSGFHFFPDILALTKSPRSASKRQALASSVPQPFDPELSHVQVALKPFESVAYDLMT